MIKHLAVVSVVALMVVACKGNRMTTFDKASPEGRWTIGDRLIRSYDVTLTNAYDSIMELARRQNWTVQKSSSSGYEATIGVLSEGKPIVFSVWAPVGRATEIGVKYGSGDRIQSVRIFTQLEELLSGKRIGAPAAAAPTEK